MKKPFNPIRGLVALESSIGSEDMTEKREEPLSEFYDAVDATAPEASEETAQETSAPEAAASDATPEAPAVETAEPAAEAAPSEPASEPAVEAADDGAAAKHEKGLRDALVKFREESKESKERESGLEKTVAELQGQLKALVAVAGEPEKPADPNTDEAYYSDPKGYIDKVRQDTVDSVRAEMRQKELARFDVEARAKYENFNEVEQTVLEHAGTNPALAAYLRASNNPYEAGYEWYQNNVAEKPAQAADTEALRKEIYAAALEEAKKQIQAETVSEAEAASQTIVADRTVGSTTTPPSALPDGMDLLEMALGGEIDVRKPRFR